MKEKIKTLIKALRCSCSTPPEDCTGCKYRGLDPYDEKIPAKPDVEIDGDWYWEYCDTETMAMDSADMLERFLDVLKALSDPCAACECLETEYNKGRTDAIEGCKQEIRKYFASVVDDAPGDYMYNNDFDILTYNKDIQDALEKLKG